MFPARAVPLVLARPPRSVGFNPRKNVVPSSGRVAEYQWIDALIPRLAVPFRMADTFNAASSEASRFFEPPAEGNK